MAQATFAIPGFLGGEISAFAQGRFDKPDYRISLNVCVNAYPAEIGPWTRRPGTAHAGTTLNGAPGRVMEFEFTQAAAVTVELTDGAARFRSGVSLITVNGSATIHQLATPWTGAAWRSLRLVQAEATAIALTATVAPQALVVTTLPSPGVNPQFSLNPATFNDGPYLDPFVNGVQVTPNLVSGIVTLTLGFPAYEAAKAYAAGAFVTASSVNYKSLVDQNVGHTPASSPTFWATTAADAAINDGRGFLGTDIGRLIRLLSEPPPWVAGTAYTTSSVVSYNPSGQPGAALYFQSLVNASATVAPGTDLTTWKIIPSGAAIWSWGKITALSNLIDRALAGSLVIGNMTFAGGNAAAFNGVFAQTESLSAVQQVSSASFTPSRAIVACRSYVGKDYSGASDQKIQQATIWPSSDFGIASGTYLAGGTVNAPFEPRITLNLRGKASAPTSTDDGTLLGTSGDIGNTKVPINIVSTDQVTAWKYVWIEQISQALIGGTLGASSYGFRNNIGQVSFFAPSGTGSGGGVKAEILGPPLLFTSPISTWRLGVYSDTTGWPSCGLYHDGRLWVAGVAPNRFDASTSNAIQPGSATVNFAPTDQYGAVPANSGISETLNADGANPIFWMDADLQGIKMGTQAGEFLIFAPTAGAMAPNNISHRLLTQHGSANIQPCRTEHTTIFVQRFAKKLLEYFPDVFSGKFSAPNLADKSIRTKPGVAELAYTNAVTPVLWGRNTDGSWWGITYKRDSLSSAQPATFYGWHGHTLGSGRIVESICSGPSVGGDLDALTMVTNDPATGVRHVEVLTDAGDELSPLASAWFLDDAVIPAVTIGINNVVLSGLPYADGKIVQVFAGGLDCGDRGPGTSGYTDFVVASGTVTVPFGDGVSAGPGRGLFTSDFVAGNPRIIVGFTYNSDGQLVRMIAPADSGSRSGPSLGLFRRVHRIALLLANTLGLWFGTSFDKLDPVRLKDGSDEDDIPALTTYSGIAQGLPDNDDGYDSMLCWRVSRPFPASVVAISGNQSAKDQ